MKRDENEIENAGFTNLLGPPVDGKRTLGASMLRFWILCLISTVISAAGLSLLLKVSLRWAAVDRSKRRLIRLLMLHPLTSSSPISPVSNGSFEGLDSEGECGGHSSPSCWFQNLSSPPSRVETVTRTWRSAPWRDDFEAASIVKTLWRLLQSWLLHLGPSGWESFDPENPKILLCSWAEHPSHRQRSHQVLSLDQFGY